MTALLVTCAVLPVLVAVIASIPVYRELFRLVSVKLENVQNRFGVTEPLTPTPATVRLYSESVASARTSIKMAGAEACPALFNDAQFQAELRAAIAERQCQVSIIVGPFILADRYGENQLVELLRELRGGPYASLLQVYLSPTRLEKHFSIIDDAFYLLESPHPPSASPRYLTRVEGYADGLNARIMEFGRLVRNCTRVQDAAVLAERKTSSDEIDRRYRLYDADGEVQAA